MSSGSVLDDREEYLKNPYSEGRIYGDFTSFYITITICVIFISIIIGLNVIFGCCSRYKEYWKSRFTGNRWIISLWTSTPHKQPPLDFTELGEVYVPTQQQVYDTVHPDEYIELQTKRESDI